MVGGEIFIVQEKIILSERQFRIMKFLEDRIEWISLEEIGKKIGCSYKTVQNELNDLKTIIPSNWMIEATKGFGIRLQRPKSCTVKNVFSKHSNVQIEALFHMLIEKETYTLDELCEKMYTNRNTLLLLVNELEINLQKYNLKIARNPYKVIGHEGLIRLFLFEMLYSNKRTTTFNSTIISKGNIRKINKFLTEISEVKLEDYSLNILVTFLHITIKRHKEGFFAEDGTQYLKVDLPSLVKEQDLYQKLSGFFYFIESLFDLEYDENERTMLYIFLLNCELEIIEITESKNRDLFNKYEDYGEFFNFILNLELELKLKQSFLESEKFLKKSFNIYHLEKLKSIIPIYYTPKGFLLDSAKYKLNNLYEIVKSFCESEKGKNGFVFKEVAIIKLTILLQTYLKTSDNFVINVLFVSSRDRILRDYTLSVLNFNFSEKSNFSVRTVNSLLEEKKSVDEWEIIITDAPEIIEMYEEKEVILVDSIISTNDLTIVSKTINKVILDKLFISEEKNDILLGLKNFVF